MGALDAPGKPFRTAAPTIGAPTITDSSISIIGVSRDGMTVIGAGNQASNIGQLYMSTDDAATWSAGLLAAPETVYFTGAVETDEGNLICTANTSILLVKAYNWFFGQPASMGSTRVLGTRTGVSVRPSWGLQSTGEITLATEYGAKSNAPLTDNARYTWMSKDWGTTWVKVFDLYSASAGDGGAGIAPVSGNHHMHGSCYDPWSGRVYVTHGDANQGVWYSDDAATLEIYTDAATTSGSATLTTASTNTTFSALSVGQRVRGNGIPDGTTITAVTNGYTVTMSATATATATGLTVSLGALTWKKLNYARAGRYQVVGVLPSPKGLYFGADGFPTGLHFAARRGDGGVAPMRNVLLTALYSAGTGAHLQVGFHRPGWDPDAPVVMGAQSNNNGTGGCLVLAHPDGQRAWKLWDDPWLTAFQSFNNVFLTARGNIVGTLESTRTATGFQTFKVSAPALPSASKL